METKNQKQILRGILLIALTGIGISSCKKNNPASPPSYTQTNLAADTVGYGGRIDTNLANAWGIAIGPTGSFWISSNHSGMTVIYDGNGAQVLAPVGIPLGSDENGASPTGVIYNSTTGFVIPGTGQPAKFIYATEDGIISAWNTGDTTIKVVDRSALNAIYKGIAMATDGAVNYIYATDFHNAKVDVFDQSFNYVGKTLSDPGIPAGFAPFNIHNIDGMLYVTYAKQKGPDNADDQSGAGNGYVDIYKPDGTLVKRFATQGTLNSPWGIAKAPDDFGQGSGAILISNFGDGRINVYDKDGNYKTQLQTNGVPVTIDGVWEIIFPQSGMSSLDPNKLYYTAGPKEESFGIFGYLKKN